MIDEKRRIGRGASRFEQECPHWDLLLQHLVFEVALHAALAAGLTAAGAAQLPHLSSVPAETGEIKHPALILLFEELDGEGFGPRLERVVRSRVLVCVVVGLERHAVVGNIVPRVVHVDVQLRSGEEFEPM